MYVYINVLDESFVPQHKAREQPPLWAGAGRVERAFWVVPYTRNETPMQGGWLPRVRNDSRASFDFSYDNPHERGGRDVKTKQKNASSRCLTAAG